MNSYRRLSKTPKLILPPSKKKFQNSRRAQRRFNWLRPLVDLRHLPEFPDAKKIIRSWQTNICVSAATNLLKGVNRIRITSDDLDNHFNLLNYYAVIDSRFYRRLYQRVLQTRAKSSIPRQQFLGRLKEKCSAECLRQFRNSDRALTDAISHIDGISYRRTTGDERKFNDTPFWKQYKMQTSRAYKHHVRLFSVEVKIYSSKRKWRFLQD